MLWGARAKDSKQSYKPDLHYLTETKRKNPGPSAMTRFCKSDRAPCVCVPGKYLWLLFPLSLNEENDASQTYLLDVIMLPVNILNALLKFNQPC